jgi:hypothetical protein
VPVGHWSFFKYGAAAGRPNIMELEPDNVERSKRRPQAVEAASMDASTASRSTTQVEVRSRSAGKHAAQTVTAAACDRRLQRSQQLAGVPTASMEASAPVVASAATAAVDVRANAAAYASHPSAATGNATSADAAAQAEIGEETNSVRGATACKSLSGGLARLPESGEGATSAAEGEARARCRPGAVALSRAFPLNARVGYSRLFSTIVMLSPRMRISEAPFGSGRLCIGVLSETPNGSGRPAFPQYLRTSTQHHVVLEEAEQQKCTRKQLQAHMHAYVNGTACIYVYRLFMSMYACLYMSAYLHMPVYLYRLLVSVYVHRCPRPRAKRRRKCIWHSKTRTLIRPYRPEWHTANWLAQHLRMSWMVSGPAGDHD